MRTLGTHVRLRRLLRLHAEQVERLRADPADRRLGEAAVNRLLPVVRDVRAAWAVDLAEAGPAAAALRRHVGRALSALEAAVAELARPGADVADLSGEFREVAVPLAFFLRGLEDSADPVLLAWLDPRPLTRSA